MPFSQQRVRPGKARAEQNESALPRAADTSADSAGSRRRATFGLMHRSKFRPIRSPDRRVEGRTAASATPPMCDFINTPPASPATKAIPGPITAGLTSKSHAVESFSSWKGAPPVRTPIRRRVAPSYRRKNRSQDCPSSRPECLALGWV